MTKKQIANRQQRIGVHSWRLRRCFDSFAKGNGRFQLIAHFQPIPPNPSARRAGACAWMLFSSSGVAKLSSVDTPIVSVDFIVWRLLASYSGKQEGGLVHGGRNLDHVYRVRQYVMDRFEFFERSDQTHVGRMHFGEGNENFQFNHPIFRWRKMT